MNSRYFPLRCSPYRLYHLPLVMLSALLLGACGTQPPGQEAAQPTAPIAKPTPTTASATPRPIAELPLNGLLVQDGEFPEDIVPEKLDRDIPEWATLKLATPPVASLWQRFERVTAAGQRPYGMALVLFFEHPEATTDAYELLIGGGGPQDVASTSTGVRAAPGFFGEQSLVLRSAYGAGPITITFTRCRAAVQLHFQGRADEESALAYARRLEHRLQAVDCDGAVEIPPAPTPTPDPRPPTPTPFPEIATSRTISTTILRRAVDVGLGRPVFVDASHGWLRRGSILFATDDSGRSWVERGRLESPIRSLSFSSALDGLAATQLGWYATADGGRSWQPTDQGKVEPEPSNDPCGPVRGVYAQLSDTRWLTLCLPDEADQYRMWKKLYRSADGGTSWELVSWSDDREGGTIPFAGRFTGWFFLDERLGWMGLGSNLAVTNDGGVTWELLPLTGVLPDGEVWLDYRVRSPYFLSQTEGFLIGYPAYRYNDPDVLYRTVDGGRSWTPVLTEPPRPPEPLGHFWPVDSRFGVAFGTREDPGAALTTTSGGGEWEQVGSLSTLCRSGITAKVRDVSFVSRLQGWAVLSCGAEPALLAGTLDSGASWQTLSMGGVGGDGLTKISFVDAMLGYAVTTEGQLLRTRDGGVSFTVVGGESSPGRILFRSEQRGWQLRDGTLYATADGGLQWERVPLGYWIDSFTVMPWGRIWAVTTEERDGGFRRRLLTTDDTGISWTEHQLWWSTSSIEQYAFLPLPTNWPTEIWMADDTHGWLSQGGQTLLSTVDGGVTWIELR